MNKKSIRYQTSFNILILFSSFLIWNCSRQYDYRIVDYFADSSSQGKVVLMFIEVNTYDTVKIKELGDELFSNHQSMIMENDSALRVLFAHIYIQKDTSKIPNDVLNKLKKEHQEKVNLEQKLNYIKSGYIYTGFSRKLDSLNIPQDSLFQSPFVIPKPGVRAEEILKTNNLMN